MTMFAIGILFVLWVAMMALTVAVGNLFYQWMRRGLYARPLTSEEQWAEQSQEALNDPEWVSVYATEFPSQNNVPS